MSTHAASLDQLLDLAARDESEGLGDAPWPPHFVKQEGEARRVQPSKAKSFSQQSAEGFGAHRFKKRSKATEKNTAESETATPQELSSFAAGGGSASRLSEAPTISKRKAPTRRTPKHPLITIANSPDKAAAMAGLTRWKEKHPKPQTTSPKTTSS